MPPTSSALVKPFGKKAWDFIMTPPAQDKRYTMLCGAVRSSKTWAMNAKLIVQLSQYEVPGKRFICGATKQTIYRNMLLDLFAVCGKDQVSYNSASGELWLLGKQYFCIGAKDEAAFKNILGSTCGVAICDEAVEYPRSFVAQLFLRMSFEGSRAYFTTNPASPNCYLKSEVIDNPAFASDLNYIHFTLHDNPNISKKAKQAIIASQTGVYYRRYIDGAWVSAEGACYSEAWGDWTLYNELSRPPGLYGQRGSSAVAHYIGIDYGTINALVYLDVIDDGTTLWVDREYYHDSVKALHQKTDGEAADDLMTFIKGSNCFMEPMILVDPSAASFKAELNARGGFWQSDACNDVLEGIRRTASALKLRKIRVHQENCPNVCREVPEYAWDEKAARAGEEKPLKRNDHSCDALRYIVNHVFGKDEWRLAS